MAEYETEEQQVEALKQWWAENGRAIVFGIVLGLGGIFGWRAWQGHQQTGKEDASLAYSQVMQALAADDQGAGFLSEVEQIRDQHGDSAYAAMASLAEARYHVEQKDLDAAATSLRWAIDEGSFEEVKAVARVRLARVLNAQGKHDTALAVLGKVSSVSFAGLVEEVRGDIHLATGDQDAAREAYIRARDSGSTTANARYLEMKIDDLAQPDASGDSQS